MFVANWINNAFAVAALEGGVKGIFHILNASRPGATSDGTVVQGPGRGVTSARSRSRFGDRGAEKSIRRRSRSQADTAPSYRSGLQCNARGLTPLGRRNLIKRMIAANC